MSDDPFAPRFEDLAEIIPIFPLAGVLLLPGGMLPLNIFEPRYLAMTRDAIRTQTRLIGMIQPIGGPDIRNPLTPGQENGRVGPEIYPTGCAGRITNFAETDDGCYQITLSGIARFHIADELALENGYRRVRPDFGPFRADMETPTSGGAASTRLLGALEHYFTLQGIQPHWATLRKMETTELVTFLSMACPFDASEKQALLEAQDTEARMHVLLSVLEMSGVLDDGGAGTRH